MTAIAKHLSYINSEFLLSLTTFFTQDNQNVQQ